MTVRFLLAAALTGAAACAQQTEPLGEAVSSTPFIEGITQSLGLAVYRGTFHGDQFYFFTGDLNDNATWRIRLAEPEGDAWRYQGPVQIGDEHPDLYPSVSGDGTRIVFTSYRPLPGEAGPVGNADLWYADRGPDGAWGEPVFMANASVRENYESGPIIRDDFSVTFHSTEPDWRTQHSRVTRWNGVEYGPFERDESAAASDAWSEWAGDRYRVWHATLSPDGRLAVIEAGELDAERRPGPSQLWASVRQGETWSAPRRLPPSVDSPELTENFLVFDAQGDRMYFVRDFAGFHSVPVGALINFAGSAGE